MLKLVIHEAGADPWDIPIDWVGDRTLGRSPTQIGRHIQIGITLDQQVRETISRVQATVRVSLRDSESDGKVPDLQVHDGLAIGSELRPSNTGIYIHKEKVSEWIRLELGTTLVLVPGLIEAVLQDVDTERLADTMTGYDLACELTAQVRALGEQNAKNAKRMEALQTEFSVALLELRGQIAARIELDSQRAALDAKQEEAIAQQQQIATQHGNEIRRLYYGMRGMVVASLAVGAFALLVSGLFTLERENRNELRDWMEKITVPLILGVGAYALRKKD